MNSPSAWRSRLRRFQRELGDFAVRNLINLGAVAGLVLLLAARTPALQLLGVAAALASLIAIVARRSRQIFGRPGRGSARLLRHRAGPAGDQRRCRLPHPQPRTAGWAFLGVGLILLLVLAEPLIKSLLGTTKIVVVNLPGVPALPAAPFSPGWILIANLITIVLGAAFAALALPGWLLVVLAAAAVPLSLMIIRFAVRDDRGEPAGGAGDAPGAGAAQPKFAVVLRRRLGSPVPAGHVAARTSSDSASPSS